MTMETKGFFLAVMMCYLFFGLFVGLTASSFVKPHVHRTAWWWAKYWFFMAIAWPVFFKVGP